MPVNRETFESIIAAVPDFRPQWEEFLREWEAEGAWYVGMGELAHYVVETYEQGKTDRFNDLFAAIESAFDENDDKARELLTVGLFEDIQNIASHRNFGSSVFRSWLGPQSIAAWDQVDLDMRRVAAWASRQQPRWWQFWRQRRKFDPEAALRQVENRELRKIIERSYRKIP